jgi:hypothetical protein
MTVQQSIEIESSREPERVNASRGPSVGLLELRQWFIVDKMKWLPDTHVEGHDEYDENLGTLHFERHNKEGGVIAGMRLTNLGPGGYGHSMSVGMLRQNPAMYNRALEQEGKFSEAAGRGDLWDLTRLVNALDLVADGEKLEVLEATLELFGAGLAITKEHGSSHPIWVFTITPDIKWFLNKSHIKVDVLAEGRLNVDDEADTLFCSIDPVEAMEMLTQEPEDDFARVSVERGHDTVKMIR